jgi:hypothetical protein
MEVWKIGMMERWEMECWNNGLMEMLKIARSSASVPIFHYSVLTPETRHLTASPVH